MNNTGFPTSSNTSFYKTGFVRRPLSVDTYFKFGIPQRYRNKYSSWNYQPYDLVYPDEYERILKDRYNSIYMKDFKDFSAKYKQINPTLAKYGHKKIIFN